jgi:hypothetical protein
MTAALPRDGRPVERVRITSERVHGSVDANFALLIQGELIA